MRAALAVALLLPALAACGGGRLDETIPGAWRAENDRSISFATSTEALSVTLPEGAARDMPPR
jgi:hypothetical protein